MILEVNNVSKQFGGVLALKNVSFSLKKGRIKTIIGPNGAGKTTLFNVITGVFTPDYGEIFFNKISIEGLKSHQIATLGITRTFQNIELFENMTVLENVMVGRHSRTKTGFISNACKLPAAIVEEREIKRKAREYLDFVGLLPREQHLSSSLPLGHQRYLEIARALAAEPKIILLDEPAAGLDEKETEDLIELIRKIRDHGITILLVEHDMNLTMTVSDEIVVLDYGSMIAEGTPKEIQYNKKVIEAYLGDSHGA